MSVREEDSEQEQMLNNNLGFFVGCSHPCWHCFVRCSCIHK